MLWQLTVDCAQPGRLAEFWAGALGYVPGPVPTGWATWEQWYDAFDVPEDERDVGVLVDPAGAGPALCFLPVPEPKTVKNRLHLDLEVGGGRHLPHDQRWPRVVAEVDRLLALGATVVAEPAGPDGLPDHVVLADPEGNEFCVV